MVIKGFIGPSGVAQSPILDQERTVNLYVEVSESQGATAPYVLYPIPGVIPYTAAGSGKGRAHAFTSGREFAVIGDQFVEIGQFGSVTALGTVGDDGLPASISSNGDGGNQLLITSNSNAFYVNLATNAVTAIAALAGIATMGASMDGFGIVLDASTSTVYLSDLNDFSVWDPTQFFQRSQAPDPWVSMAVSNKYLYLFGTETSEPWYNAGTAPIPFQPTAVLMNYGISAPWSRVVSGANVAWIGATSSGQNMVLKTSGLTPDVISTYSTELAFDNMAQISDAIGDAYYDRGHNFFVFTFPFANQTWVWDETTPTWCERGSWDAELGNYNLWRPIFHAFAFGEHRLLDVDGPAVFKMSPDYYTDVDGESGIRWLRRAPALVRENQREWFGTFELLTETGLGTVIEADGTYRAPQVALSISNDGGKTFGSEQFRSMGSLGEYNQRVRWTRCGSGRKRVFQLTGSDPVPYRLLAAYLN